MRPAGPMGSANHSQTPRPFAHNVIGLIGHLHHQSLIAMLSNQAPNLEAKMEKGISSNQRGVGNNHCPLQCHTRSRKNNYYLLTPNSHGPLSSLRQGGPPETVSGDGWRSGERTRIPGKTRTGTAATSLASAASKPSVGKGQTLHSHFLPPWILLIAKLQSPLKLVSFHILEPPSEIKKKKEKKVGEKQKPGEQGHGQAHCLPPRGWGARSTSRLGAQIRGQSSPRSRAGHLSPCLIPRNTYQEAGKHTKPYYWEPCRQIINLLGTIEAFRYFWLQMLVTHTCIQTSFFSPLE